MKIEANARMPYPRSLVFSTYRDRLPKLVPFLPNIKGIEVLSRQDEPELGQTRLVNRWHAKGDIPKVAQKILKPEMLAWDDHASWDERAWTVDWRIETKMFTESVRCHGHNVYLEDGEGTLLQIRGELEVNLAGIPGVPRFLAGSIAPAVERFIVALLTPNLTSVAKGLEAFLRAEGEAEARSGA
ncbi:MAG: hypothetical protein IPK13_18330 [Deltaproteobacteria bacterium]|nr:hypothetical protein [Deltaproteobacteria bacterium]